MPNKTNPTTSERFFFDNNGYLVLENLLKENHVEILLDKLHQVIEQRRNAEKNGTTKTGMTSIDGDNTRIFYILDDDPLFLDMIDLPEIWPYIIGFLNENRIIMHPTQLLNMHLKGVIWGGTSTDMMKVIVG